jgi:glutamyl/glutaminyl-tRNA synthetase
MVVESQPQRSHHFVLVQSDKWQDGKAYAAHSHAARVGHMRRRENAKTECTRTLKRSNALHKECSEAAAPAQVNKMLRADCPLDPFIQLATDLDLSDKGLLHECKLRRRPKVTPID